MQNKNPEMWKWFSAGNADYIGYNKSNDSFNPYPINIMALGTQFGLYFMMVHFYAPEWISIIVTLFLGFLWQVKNAMVPFVNYDTATATTKYRWMGGFGYSWKTEIYGAGGVLLAFLLDVMWPPAIQPSREEEENSF